MKNINDLITKFGGYRELAAAIGSASVTVAVWKHRGNIPAQHYPAIIAAAKARRIRGVSFEALYAMGRAEA